MIRKNLIDKDILKELNNNKIVVGFSGGPDSIFLLETLHNYYQDKIKEKVIIAYVNYHDSIYTHKEEEIVNLYLKKYNLTCYQLHIIFNKNKDHNFEEWAREVRYKFFIDIAKIEKANLIGVAHHKDDLIETYLIQKERNNLPRYYGLVPICNYHEFKLIRPLLNVYKTEIINYLKEKKLVYYDDITNYLESNKRHTIRKKNLSVLEKENIIKEIKKGNDKTNNLYNKFKYVSKDNLVFYNKLDDDSKKRYIFFLLDQVQITSSKKEGFSNLIYDYLNRKEKGILKLDDKYSLYKEVNYFFISSIFNDVKYEFKFTKEGIYKNNIFEIDITSPSKFNIKEFPFVIRNVKDDDFISTNLISKDVSNFLKKQKVPLALEKIYPVFVNNKNEIFYVPFYVDIINKKIPFHFIIGE